MQGSSVSRVSAVERKLRTRLLEQYHGYAASVRSGSRITGRLEKAMVSRQSEDLGKEWRWRFDEQAGLDPLVWMAFRLRFPIDEKMGEVIQLEPWQVFVVMCLFGWVDGNGSRRFIDAYLEVPRKNGKSTLVGCIMDYMAFSRAEAHGLPCYIGASTLEQAQETFLRAANALRLGPNPGVKVANSKYNKVLSWHGQQVIAISALPKDGKLPHFFCLDEYHQAKDNALLNSIESGNVSNRNCMTIKITTAGFDLHGVCKEEHDRCVRVLDGDVVDDRCFAGIWTPDEGDSIDNPATWEKANPNWGVSVNEDLFSARYDKCKTSASEMLDFKTKNLNMWVEANTRWANMTIWKRLCCGAFDRRMLDGMACYGGLDLSGNSDFTAITLDFPVREADAVRHYQLYQSWIPEARATDLERQLRVPLRQWVEDGYVAATPGEVIDFAFVSRWIEDAMGRYDLRLCAADKYKLPQLMTYLSEDAASVLFVYSQGMMSMSPAINEFERQYLLGNIRSGGDPVMRWMMSCVESKQDDKGNVKFVKPRYDRARTRIDLPVTAVMALDTAVTHAPAADTGNLLDGISFA